MNFGIADIKEPRLKHVMQGIKGDLINSAGPDAPRRSTKLYGNGCRKHKSDPSLPPTKTGCFTCPFDDCGWNAWRDNG